MTSIILSSANSILASYASRAAQVRPAAENAITATAAPTSATLAPTGSSTTTTSAASVAPVQLSSASGSTSAAAGSGGGGGSTTTTDILETTETVYNADGSVTTITKNADGSEDEETTSPTRPDSAENTLNGGRAYESSKSLANATTVTGTAGVVA